MSTPTNIAKADLAKALKDNEDLVLSETTKWKATDLSKKLFQSSVISDSMMDQFSSLDHSRVEPQLQLRYLLRLVTHRIQQDGSVGDKFLVLLEELGEKSLCEYLRKTKSGEEQPEAKTMCLDITFSTDDIRWILEEIAEVSPKWEMLGIALGLPTFEVKNIKGDDNMKNLSNIINAWLSGKGTTPLTISILAEALRSNLVRNVKLAKEVEEKFISHKESKSANTNTCTSSLNFTIIKQSDREVEVADGKSTLLLVQASQRENASYQWNKDGQPLTDSFLYSGVHDDILSIKCAYQGTVGEYSCRVRTQEREVVSNKMTLIVIYPTEKRKLLDLYSIHSKVPLDDAWPPLGPETFINIALNRKSTDNSQYCVDGDADKIIAKRHTIKYEEVFSTYKTKSLVLVEGRPGSGKTTLVYKIIKDWTEGNLLFGAKLVFLLSLRMLAKNTLHEKNLSSLLQDFYNDKDLEGIIADMHKRNGEGVCFVFDGLDEYHRGEGYKSVVFKLLHKEYLPLAMIIVTSRPGAMERLKTTTVTQQIEVFGFTKDQIFEYIDKFPFDSSQDSSFGPSNLKEYLRLHPNVFHMCYLPIHAAIICFVYKTEGGHLPDTQTKIYEEFTRSMILRHVKRENKRIKLKSLQNLQGCYKEYFNKLCLLAFNMTRQSQQIIDEDEIDSPIGEATSPHGDWSLGLVTGNLTAQLCGISTSYTFLHLTLQEFLAAYYLVHMESEKKREFIMSKFTGYQQESMWIFYFGLETFQSKTEMKYAIETCCNTIYNALEFGYESQQKIVCDEILKLKEGKVNSQLQPTNMPALVYTLCNSSQSVLELKLDSSESSYVEILMQQIQGIKFQKLQKLDINCFIHNPNTLKHLSNVLKSCENLQNINLQLINLTATGGEYLTEGLQHITHIPDLTLKIWSSIEISHPNATQYNSIIYLKLHYRDLTVRNTSELASGLQSVDTDRLLSLMKLCGYSGESNIGLTAFLNQICCLTQVESLALAGYNMDVRFCKALATNTCLCRLVNLEELLIRDCKINSDGAFCLGYGLQHLTKLKKLILSDNNIGSDGAIRLSSQLQHLTKLKELSLSGNNIDAQAATQVIIALKECKELKYIKLNKNSKDDRKFGNGFQLNGVFNISDNATIVSLAKAVAQHNEDADIYVERRKIHIFSMQTCQDNITSTSYSRLCLRDRISSFLPHYYMHVEKTTQRQETLYIRISYNHFYCFNSL